VVPQTAGPDGDPIERLARDAAGPGYRLARGPVWLTARPAAQTPSRQGWKLHISSRAATFPQLVEMTVPVLAAAGCVFKLARSQRILTQLNDGITAPASVGKAITVYPDQARVRELGYQLADLLAGWPGPRVLSDRQVTPAAPVYYRYGPFAASWEVDSLGRLATMLHGPDGERFNGAATLDYRQPPWTADPFDTAIRDSRPGGPPVLGGRYRITAGRRKAAQGNVYTAVDPRDGAAVVIKQARPLVADDGQVDARWRLRNERRVLQALDGMAGVPRLVDHFRHAGDEYLVTSDCGPASLAEDVYQNGPWPLAGPAPRNLPTLAARLAGIVSGLHRRGVVMRDLSPKNVVIGPAGASLVDFGIAAYDGLHLPGATPGYAPARQVRGEPPTEGDDYFALGMTLLFAVTAADPVALGDDPGLSRVRALQAIGSAWGEAPTGTIAATAGLLSDHEDIAAAAFHRLATGQPAAAAGPLPTIGTLTAAIVTEVTGTLLDDLLRQTGELLDGQGDLQASHDASVYEGGAGIGLELLCHPGESRAAALVDGLVTFTATAAEQAKLPPGLFTGSTGVSVFHWAARAADAAAPVPEPDWQPEGDDLVLGAAGVGLGHLWLYQAGAGTAHLALARRCAGDLLAGAVSASPYRTRDAVIAGVDSAAGRAHGLAGVTEFLLTLASETGDEGVRQAAAEYARRLADRTTALLPVASRPDALPLAMSWCQGLAGIGQALVQASVVLGDTSFAGMAQRAAAVILGYLPRLTALGRCCGAAGAGHLFIDLAVAGQDERWWQAASEVAQHMLLRSAGSPGHRTFVTGSAEHSSLGWAFGAAGLLSFFRRLDRHGGPDGLPLFSPVAPGSDPARR